MCIKCARECAHRQAILPMWRSEDNCQESLLSFHWMGSGYRTQIGRLRRQVLFPTEHLISFLYLKVKVSIASASYTQNADPNRWGQCCYIIR